jgi:hypothetical protein
METLEALQAAQQIRYPSELSGFLFDNVRGFVSHEAMRKIMQQRKLLVLNAHPCTGSFTTSLGLPCAHSLQPLLQREEPLQLRHFHQHWRLRRQGNPRVIIQPRRVSDSITITSTLLKTSTRREPCAFEAIDKTKKPKAPPKCSVCGEIGHTLKSRACPLRYHHLFPTSEQAPVEATQTDAPEAIRENSVIVTASRETYVIEVIDDNNPPDVLTNTADPGATPETSVAQIVAHGTSVIDLSTDDELLGILGSTPATDDEIEAPEVEAPEVEAPEVEPPETSVEQPSALRRSRRQPSARPSAREPTEARRLPFDDPNAVVRRYKAARAIWYASLPPGSKHKKTNEGYRKAMQLPKKYNKSKMKWCLDYKYMGTHDRSGRRPREWTDEEKMCYIDFYDQAEKEAEVAMSSRIIEERLKHIYPPRRGINALWDQAARDAKEQQRRINEEDARRDAILNQI